MLDALGLLAVIFTIFADLFIAFVVYRNNPKSASNKLLSILATLLMFWAVFNYLALLPRNESIRLLWVRSVMFITTPLGPLIFLLSSTIPGEKINVKRNLLIIMLTLNIAIALLSFTPYIFSGLVNSPDNDGGFKLFPGPAIVLYAVNLIGFLTWGFIILFRRYRKSEGLLKRQLGIVIIGLFVSFSLMTLTNFIAVVVFKSIKLTFFGPIFTLIMIGFIAYAIVKHKLLNIKLLATQLFVGVILLILLAKIFTYVSIGELIVDMTIFVIVLIFSILLIKSITKEIEQKEKLAELNQRLKQLNAQKDEFISMAAHELSAPMTAIKGYVSMVMEGDTGDIPEKARGFLADANNITDRLVRLVNNMFNVSRIEEGRMVYQIEEENLSRVVTAVFNQFAPELERKGLKYDLEIPSELKDKVRVDPDRVQEVIGNLLSNAVKYTDKGFVKVKLVQPTSKTVRVEVSDSGSGISLVEQKKLFQKFYRVETNVGKTTGTGLGLYISRLLVEKFSGLIGIESQEGKGSNFWFELPILNPSN